MRGNRTRSAALGAAVALTALLGAVGVSGAAENITTETDSQSFSKPEFHANEGERPLLVGNGIDFHNVTGKGRGPDGRRLFRSRDIRSGTSPVDGVQYLAAGTYPFECTLHLGMEATLIVDSAGTPKARPRVVAAVLRQTLERVRRTGRLRIRLRSSTGAQDVAVTARGAGALLARGSNIDLGKGASRVIRLPLTRRGRAALAGRRAAKISLRAKVPFGLAATASRTVRGG
jgi:plastocyanin